MSTAAPEIQEAPTPVASRACGTWGSAGINHRGAGVLEDGSWTQQEEGTPQGGSASPLLANLYLHYAFDQWVQQWRRKKARGEVIVVRWADDFIVGFERQSEAEQFLGELKERLKKFGLELHSEKTRL